MIRGRLSDSSLSNVNTCINVTITIIIIIILIILVLFHSALTKHLLALKAFYKRRIAAQKQNEENASGYKRNAYQG